RAAQGKSPPHPPAHFRAQIEQAFHPLPIWYPPFEGAAIDETEFPLHALTQRPMAMYHSWGSQNAWLRQIHTANPLYVPGPVCDAAGLKDADWVWIISRHGKVLAPVKRMEGVNAQTVWTWNAIGKRAGAWRLSKNAPEAQKGFLLNHLIHELLPPRADGSKRGNYDPITGQAAWFDLRVRLEKADPDEARQRPHPHDEIKHLHDEPPPREVRYGQEWTGPTRGYR
ncbi:MAG: molybdopterin dinucleotide binding domain-containing protein, partial [Hyphomicrobiales bacterium]